MVVVVVVVCGSFVVCLPVHMSIPMSPPHNNTTKLHSQHDQRTHQHTTHDQPTKKAAPIMWTYDMHNNIDVHPSCSDLSNRKLEEANGTFRGTFLRPMHGDRLGTTTAIGCRLGMTTTAVGCNLETSGHEYDEANQHNCSPREPYGHTAAHTTIERPSTLVVSCGECSECSLVVL